MDNKPQHDLVDRSQKSPLKNKDGIPSWHTSSTLKVPESPPVSRRPSPRVEDMIRSPRKAQRTRQRLKGYQTFDDAVRLLQKSQHIVVLTGAGISTSVGIPDFRSDKGLYNKLSKVGITQPEDFFSMSYFQENPEDFFKYVREVVPTAVPGPDGTYKLVKRSSRDRSDKTNTVEVPQFTPTHAFLAMLQADNKLLTNYTQNIDGLERAAGLPSSQFIQCHGSWDSATCLTCGKSSSAKKYLPVVHAGNVPYCKCFNEAPEPQKEPRRKNKKGVAGKKRKRADSFSDHSSDDGTKPLEPPRGLLKPDLVFFEEKITPLYHSRLESDRPKIDLLIIIGTSLKVAPIQYMLFKIRPDVPQIYISKERFSGALCSLPGVQVDIELLGECDMIIEELCRRAGWEGRLKDHYWRRGQTKVKRIPTGDEALKTSKITDHQDLRATYHDPMGHKSTEVDSRQAGSTVLEISSIKVENASSTVQNIQIHRKEQQSATASTETTPQSTGVEERLQLASVKDEPSKVKVELVEGTEHQWRISRRR